MCLEFFFYYYLRSEHASLLKAKLTVTSCLFVIGLQGIFDRGNEVQPKTDFILGPRKPFPEQLETERRIQKSSKQVTSKLYIL